MKTIKNSISMKAVLTFVVAISMTALVNGQFQTPSPDSPVTQTPTEEVRTGSTITYDLTAGHSAGEQYRWEIIGGTITTATGGTISGGGTIVEFAADVYTITIDWDQAPTAIASISAQIQVQKLSGTCYSQIQTLPINVWSLPTANISDADIAICSGEAVGGSVTVDLTGAPDALLDGTGFDVTYTITTSSANITLGDLVTDPSVAATTISTDNATISIPLPADLANLGTTPETLTVTLTAANDDFDTVDATITDATYVITVNPVPTTGDIQSTSSLTRRL